MQRGAGNEIGADRGGGEKKEGDEQFVQAQGMLLAAEMQNRRDQDAANAQRGGLGRSVQAGEDVGQTGQPDGTDERERAADQQKKEMSVSMNMAGMVRSYSMMSPRSRYLHRATVPMKPIMAMSRAASKNSVRF